MNRAPPRLSAKSSNAQAAIREMSWWKASGCRHRIRRSGDRFQGDYQHDRHDHEQQGNAVQETCMQWQIRQSVAEYPAQLKTQQDLGAEYEHSSFFEGSFDELRDLH